MCYTWYRVLILVPRVHVVYFSSLSQVVNYPEFLDTRCLPHMPKFHRIVGSLSFRSAAFERLFRDGGAEFVWGWRWRDGFRWNQGRIEPQLFRLFRAAEVSASPCLQP